MGRFILRRLIVIVPMLLVVVSLTWGLIRLAPGNFYSSDRKLPAAIERNIREKYGLDKPWYVQYGRMLSSTIRGDFGESLKYPGTSVNSILAATLPVLPLGARKRLESRYLDSYKAGPFPRERHRCRARLSRPARESSACLIAG